MKITHTHNNKTITADVIRTQGRETRNLGMTVFIVGIFQTDDDKRPGCGWDLMKREYRTTKGLIKAARRYNMGIIEA